MRRLTRLAAISTCVRRDVDGLAIAFSPATPRLRHSRNRGDCDLIALKLMACAFRNSTQTRSSILRPSRNAVVLPCLKSGLSFGWKLTNALVIEGICTTPSTSGPSCTSGTRTVSGFCWEFLCGQRTLGTLVYAQTFPDVAGCAPSCNTDPGCEAVYFNRSDGYCQGWANVTEISPDSQHDSAYIVSRSPCG